MTEWIAEIAEILPKKKNTAKSGRGSGMKKGERGLSAGRLAMMALGTVIGGSFFLGSSVAVHAAGPAILLSYVLGGVLVYFILTALSEMTVANPDSGSFRTFASQIFGQGAGFVVGWVYWTGMVLAMSSEATAVSVLVRQWIPGLNVPLFGSVMISAVTLLNLMGANRLSRLESGLAAIKIAAVAVFILFAAILIFGLVPGRAPVGLGALPGEAFAPGGLRGVAGSMLIVVFAYAGFEIIGLAASETENPKETVPRAIRYTVLGLTGLYILSTVVLLPLIPTDQIDENSGFMVTALNRHGFGWAGDVLNLVLITAILSTMLAAMFGLGRMMRSLAEDGLAPAWLRDGGDVPRRGILFSGFAMLAGLALGLLFPRAYLFLISSGGFAMLFTYAAVMATHIRFRRKNGCPPDGKCQMAGFPYTSYFTLAALIAAILSMPFVPGQGAGLAAGAVTVAFYMLCYWVLRPIFLRGKSAGRLASARRLRGVQSEISLEQPPPDRKKD
ncbi:Amino acid permease [Ruminococcaceae bacterium BL-6]|nr:Amino acid permease [Ruminococcaceae bacterium BL-6]